MGYHRHRDGSFTAGPFPGGMNNKQKDHDLPDDCARNIVNCNISPSGKPSLRQGSTKVYTGIDTKGSFSCPVGIYFVEGSKLCSFNVTDNTSTVLFYGVHGSTFAYHYFNGIVYFTDNIISKKIVGNVVLPWGLTEPSAPKMAAISGTYAPGTYLAKYVWVDLNGLESGASLVSSIELEGTSGIRFFNMPGLPVGAVSLRIYLTTPNGKVFYHVLDIANTSYDLSAGAYDGGSVLDMEYVSPPPTGNILGLYKGRMYISSGKVVWYSEPYSYDHFKLSESFLQFPFDITIMAPVDNGIFFASNYETHYYGGSPEDGFNIVTKFDYGGIFGTFKRIPNTDDVLWLSQRGVVRGSADGQCVNIQEENVATETGTSGTLTIREQDGVKQVIAGINDPTTSKLAATSFIDAEIIRRT